jgi:ketosteroid isomerase-like protein
MTNDHPNVRLVRSLFSKPGSGDNPITFEGYLEGGWDARFAPDVVYCGTSVRGELQMALGKDSLLELSREAMNDHEPDERGEELLDCVAWNDELVSTHVRCHRVIKSTGERVSYEYVMTVRIEDGMITRGGDVGERKIDDMYRKLRGYSELSPVIVGMVSTARPSQPSTTP